MTALQQNLGLTTEQFASALDYDPHTLQHYTCHEADRVFGAKVEAFSPIWEGAFPCKPDYKHNEMN